MNSMSAKVQIEIFSHKQYLNIKTRNVGTKKLKFL